MALSGIAGVGGVTARKLLDRFGTLSAAFAADDELLLSIPRITPEIVAAIREADLDRLEATLEDFDDQGVHILTWEDDDFPANLLAAKDAPFLLYAVGDVSPQDDLAVAVVGSREASARSMDAAESLARELAEQGVTVVSGLAIGIDTAAHRGALASRRGRTLTVLGSGLKAIHPRSNSQLAWDISERGAVLTEYAPDVPVRGQQLMSRDRIVSGLSRAVIVVEAGLASGSMDTAERARKQDRLVFAVPGSPGTDALIRSGAPPIDPASGVDEIVGLISEQSKPVAEQPSLWDS
jgi:DNA processing protein